MKKQKEITVEVKEIETIELKKEVKRSSEISCTFCGYIQPASFTKCQSCNNDIK